MPRRTSVGVRVNAAELQILESAAQVEVLAVATFVRRAALMAARCVVRSPAGTGRSESGRPSGRWRERVSDP